MNLSSKGPDGKPDYDNVSDLEYLDMVKCLFNFAPLHFQNNVSDFEYLDMISLKM